MNKTKTILTIILILLILSISCSTLLLNLNEDRSFYRNVLNDMFLPAEGRVHGLPDYITWQFFPRIGFGMQPRPGWNALLAWGQVYAGQNCPNPDADFPLVRVHIKDLQLFIYQKNGTWSQLIDADGKKIWGSAYVEDFENDEHKETEIRYETGGGISVKAGSGYNFHFGSGRVTIPNKNNIAGIFVVCKARLIGTENYSTLPEDLYFLNVGGDYWKDLNIGWAPDNVNNGDIAIGRFKRVTPAWQYFTMHTFPKEKIDSITLPIKPISTLNN